MTDEKFLAWIRAKFEEEGWYDPAAKCLDNDCHFYFNESQEFIGRFLKIINKKDEEIRELKKINVHANKEEE
jgi:hypothetical protein